MFCPGTGKIWNETKYFLKYIVMIYTDLTCWYILHDYCWCNRSYFSSVLNKAECELYVEARINMSKEASLPLLGYGILILLEVSVSSSIVTCSDLYIPRCEMENWFLIGGQEKDFWLTCSWILSICLSSAVQHFHGTLPSCFWEPVLFCLVLNQHPISLLHCVQTCAYVWKWVPPCQWETLLLWPFECLWYFCSFGFYYFPSLSGAIFFSPLVCSCVRFIALWSKTHSEAHTVAFLNYCFGVSAISSVIKIHKYVSDKTYNDIFSRLLPEAQISSLFIVSWVYKSKIYSVGQ